LTSFVAMWVLAAVGGMEPRDLGAAIDACRPTSIGVVATIVWWRRSRDGVCWAAEPAEVRCSMNAGGDPRCQRIEKSEASDALTERDERRDQESLERRKVGEVVEVIILAIVAIATAWSSYQGARWDGRNAFLYGTSTELWVMADEADTLGG